MAWRQSACRGLELAPASLDDYCARSMLSTRINKVVLPLGMSWVFRVRVLLGLGLALVVAW